MTGIFINIIPRHSGLLASLFIIKNGLYLFILLYWADSTTDMCPGKKLQKLASV